MNDLTGLKKQVRECIENAYCKGYKDCQATVNEQLDDARKEGYNKGLAHSKASRLTYNDGLQDAWECAKKISLDPRVGGISIQVLKDIFDDSYTLTDISDRYTVQEVLTIIREYEKEQKQTNWREASLDEMTEEQLRQAVKDLQKQVSELEECGDNEK